MSNWLSGLKPFKSLFKKEEDPNHAWEELARWKKEWTCWAKDEAQLQEDWARYKGKTTRTHLDIVDERKLQTRRLQEDWVSWEKDWACYQESVTRLYEGRTCLEEGYACFRKESIDEFGKVTNAHWKMAPWNFTEDDPREGHKFRAHDLEIRTALQKFLDKKEELDHLENELNDRQCSLKKCRDELENRQSMLTSSMFTLIIDKGDNKHRISHQLSLIFKKDLVNQLSDLSKQLENREAKSKALRLKLLRDPVALPWLKLIRFLQKTVKKAKIMKTPNHPESYFPVMVAVLDFLQSSFAVEML
jgi:hypothetical protein